MLNYDTLYSQLSNSPASCWIEQLPAVITETVTGHGQFEEWQQLLARLPVIQPSKVELLDRVEIGRPTDTDKEIRNLLEGDLRRLRPWRKGPIDLFGIRIDTEWRSDWKWDRIKDHISLHGHTILDVGCGNGYYALRMIGAGARLVVGLDPFLLYVVQFEAIRRYVPEINVHVLPLGVEHLPPDLRMFDTVFSMGVFYHRRSPLDHLSALRHALKAGGRLILETLVIDGRLGEVLVPEGRYAQMRNVYFIPTCLTLESWLRKIGFREIDLLDMTPTTTAEQRPTEWMTFHSLQDFLDSEDATKTVEGHPAPVRAIFLAEIPS